jgi:carbon storage regulator
MLILTRKQDEEIIINSGIRIKILSISENHVKVGISAPPEIEILRGEIYENVKKCTIDASKNSGEKVDNLTQLKINKIGKK